MEVIIAAFILSLGAVVATTIFVRVRSGAQYSGSSSLGQPESELTSLRKELVQKLEQVSVVSRDDARKLLIAEIEAEVRQDTARMVKQMEEDAKRDADRRVRQILSTVMQRMAAGYVAATTVTVFELPNDKLKGRIIGKEGRNIRTLEGLTGVDFIIDDTPGAVVLSAFDGVRRELARMTLEQLVADGRIHPTRIEETYQRAKRELDARIVQLGESAALDTNVPGLHGELCRLLGRLSFRTSYGQNVLAHSIECAGLAALMAAELGADALVARRAALLHDIGKAVSHEVEGPHALVGGQFARKYKESEAVAHAIESHHNEIEPQTVEAVIVQTADTLSGARPGARRESLEHYIKRLRDLEQIANKFEGVDRVYAMQAGRDIRVMVSPITIDDAQADLLAHRIARAIEQQLEYPGQIKVTIIRELRVVEYAN